MRGGPTYTYRQVRKDIANWLRHNACAPLDKDGTSKISDFLDEEDGATWCGYVRLRAYLPYAPPRWHPLLLASIVASQAIEWSSVPSSMNSGNHSAITLRTFG